MRQAMEKWLSRHQITFSADTANSICSSLGLDGEKVDECLGLCYQLEKGNINEVEFTGGLSVLTGKEPEEVMGVLKGMNQPPSSKKDELAIACYNALANHGIAVHYTILGKMVRRYYKPEITDQQVLSCLSRNKDLFRRLEDYPGAYFLAGKKEGRTYPEIGEVSDPKKD